MPPTKVEDKGFKAWRGVGADNANDTVMLSVRRGCSIVVRVRSSLALACPWPDHGDSERRGATVSCACAWRAHLHEALRVRDHAVHGLPRLPTRVQHLHHPCTRQTGSIGKASSTMVPSVICAHAGTQAGLHGIAIGRH